MPHLGPRVHCSWRVCIFQQKNAHLLNLYSVYFEYLLVYWCSDPLPTNTNEELFGYFRLYSVSYPMSNTKGNFKLFAPTYLEPCKKPTQAKTGLSTTPPEFAPSSNLLAWNQLILRTSSQTKISFDHPNAMGFTFKNVLSARQLIERLEWVTETENLTTWAYCCPWFSSPFLSRILQMQKIVRNGWL